MRPANSENRGLIPIRVPRAGFYQRVRHFREPAPGPAASLALNVSAGSLVKQEQFLRQFFRFHEAGFAAELHQALALLILGFFDDGARGMVLVGKLDGRIRHRTTAKIRGAEIVSDAFDQCAKLRIRIARMSASRFIVSGDGVAVQRAQIFRHQQVLRLEVTVEGHLIGLRGGGDFIDADGADSLCVEEVARRFEDAFARRNLRFPDWLPYPLHNLFLHHLTRYLPVSTFRDVTIQYHDIKRKSLLLFALREIQREIRCLSIRSPVRAQPPNACRPLAPRAARQRAKGRAVPFRRPWPPRRWAGAVVAPLPAVPAQRSFQADEKDDDIMSIQAILYQKGESVETIAPDASVKDAT